MGQAIVAAMTMGLRTTVVMIETRAYPMPDPAAATPERLTVHPIAMTMPIAQILQIMVPTRAEYRDPRGHGWRVRSPALVGHQVETTSSARLRAEAIAMCISRYLYDPRRPPKRTLSSACASWRYAASISRSEGSDTG